MNTLTVEGYDWPLPDNKLEVAFLIALSEGSRYITPAEIRDLAKAAAAYRDLLNVPPEKIGQVIAAIKERTGSHDSNRH